MEEFSFDELVYSLTEDRCCQILTLLTMLLVVALLVRCLYTTVYSVLVRRLNRRLDHMSRVLRTTQEALSKTQEESEALRKKLTVLQDRHQAQRKLCERCDAYKCGKLEKITDLTNIVLHSFNNSRFLNNEEVSHLLEEVSKTSRTLKEGRFEITTSEPVSFVELLQKAQNHLQWELIKGSIVMNIRYDRDQNFLLTTDPFLLEVLLLGLLKSMLFSLYAGSILTVSVQESKNCLTLLIDLRGHVIDEWYPLSNRVFDYGRFFLTGNQIHDLLKKLKTSIVTVSAEKVVITIENLDNGEYAAMGGNVVPLHA